MTLTSAQNLIDLPVSDVPENVSTILTGWGRHRSFGPLSDILQKVTLTTITNEDCQTYYNNTILPSHLCTLEHKGTGACKVIVDPLQLTTMLLNMDTSFFFFFFLFFFSLSGRQWQSANLQRSTRRYIFLDQAVRSGFTRCLHQSLSIYRFH